MNNTKKQYLKHLLHVLRFDVTKNSNQIYEKNFADGSSICVNLEEESIIYSENIRMDRKTICNFSKNENFVVLECVVRLLDLGYKGSELYLEKDMGDGKDYIDIAIYDRFHATKIFAIIECKEYGQSFFDAKSKAQKNGTQILRYAIQDKHCLYMILYSSICENKKIVRIEESIDLSLYNVDNREELLDAWDKTFININFFERQAFSSKEYVIKRKDLTPISVNDIGIIGSNKSIYSEFKQILRRHSISDKDNAYNKIFNLFLCKIVDEDEKRPDEDMDFQWRIGEDADTVLLRLSDLYKKGMDSKFNISITDYSEKDVEDIIQSEISSKLKTIFVELRLYKNNEFAFKEVYNKRTFYENASIIKEIVRLLENKQIKYETKQQFLGDFFEKLLNMGIKQEVGQFFTPIPIAEFILRSLPVESIINEKIASKKEFFLPYVIDYSCGSGHFLTEAMERIQQVLNLIDARQLTPNQKNRYNNWNNFSWAKEFIYGVEDDYRLAKTSKVSCFLNGDGEGNVIYANGLDSFNSPNYWGRLKINSDDKTNERFDIVVANPPYSVDDFKDRLKNGKTDFKLFDKCGRDDIESLFVERTGQLLVDNGVAGIILPSTFLTTETYSAVRQYVLTNFHIKALCYLGKQTFSATDKSTCILFLQKISREEKKRINRIVSNFYCEYKDFSYENSDNLGSKYIEKTYGISLHEYKNMILEKAIDVDSERTNLFIWVANYKAELPIINSHEGKEELEFLGYKHTNKKNYEGIVAYPSGSEKIDTMLFDNVGDGKLRLNEFVLKSYENHKLGIPLHLEKYVKYKEIKNIIDFEDDKYFIITKEFKNIDSNLPMVEIADDTISATLPKSGDTAPKGVDLNSVEGIPFIRANQLNRIDSQDRVIAAEYITPQKADKYKLKLFKKGSIIFPKSGQSINRNNIAILAQDSYVVNHLAVLTCKDDVIARYVFLLLKYYKTSNLKLDDSADYPSIKLSTIKKFQIPFTYEVAQRVYTEFERLSRGKTKEEREKIEVQVLKKYVYK